MLPIPTNQIDDAIAALVALRAAPIMDTREYLEMLRAIDAIEGRDALVDAISAAEHDLTPCEDCKRVNLCICDQPREDKVAWGMAARQLGDGHFQVQA